MPTQDVNANPPASTPVTSTPQMAAEPKPASNPWYWGYPKDFVEAYQSPANPVIPVEILDAVQDFEDINFDDITIEYAYVHDEDTREEYAAGFTNPVSKATSAVEPVVQPRHSPGILRARVENTLRSVLSALHDAEPQYAQQLIQRIRSSERVLRALTSESCTRTLAVLEVLSHEATVLSAGRLDLFHLPVSQEYDDSVRDELALVVAEIGVSTPVDPHAEWQDLVEGIQRVHTRYASMDLVSGIDAKLPVFDLMKRFHRIEPPTSVKSVRRARGARTAQEISETLRAEQAGRVPYRFSSGLPTLDVGYTGVGEARGFIAPGQFNVVMGPTGTGKSSFANSTVPAFSMDLKNWGLENALQVVFHTEEETPDKLKGFRMNHGQKYHALSANLVIDACGTSRKRIAEILYDLVMRADDLSRASKRPIVEFLPYIVQIDYIQALLESSDKDPTTASAVSAEFFLRGVCAWNPEEMAKFSGVEYREYAGAAWPAGMEQHRVAVIAYAQLIKIDNATLFYQSGKRGVQLSDFALLNERDDPCWDLKEGDLRLFGQNQIRGSGIILQNAHAIVILHRSVPYTNAAVKDEFGNMHLTDTRGRVLFDKTRSGSSMKYAPMRFDVQSNGFRAQYFDEVAENAIEKGTLTLFDPSYSEPGDPILPIRPYRNPLEETRY